MNVNFDDMTEDEKEEAILKHMNYVRNLSPEELISRLDHSLISTEVILDGYNLVTNISEGHGIAVAGILNLRESIAETIDWITNNLLEIEEKDDESDEL